MTRDNHRDADACARFLKAGLIVSHLLVLTAAAWTSESGQAGDGLAQRRVFVMGTWLDVEVRARSNDAAHRVAGVVIETVETAENRLSTWGDSSELSKINGSPVGAWSELSALLAIDLEEAWRWQRATEGAFSPRVGSLIEAWGLRSGGRVPSAAEIRRALELSSADRLELSQGRVRRLDEGAWIEEGAFGKGAALRDAARSAVAAGASCVVLDFGGQTAVAGRCGLVRIALSDPNRRQSAIATLALPEGSVATSGNSERSLEVADRRLGHLIDPRSGMPAPDWGSVTVVAVDPFAADCVATALYVMGPQRGAEWLGGQPGLEAVFVERKADDVTITASSGLRGRLSAAGGRPVNWLPQKNGRLEHFGISMVSDFERNTGRPVRKDF